MRRHNRGKKRNPCPSHNPLRSGLTGPDTCARPPIPITHPRLRVRAYRLFRDRGHAKPCRARIVRYLERRGVITLGSDADSDVLCVSEELADRAPALGQLAAAAVSGLAPAGPELRRKPRELQNAYTVAVLTPSRSAT